MNDLSVFSHTRLNSQSYAVTESYGYNPKIPNSYMHIFVVIGDEKIAVIDSGIAGTSGLREYIETYIVGKDNKKPIINLLTHNHLDHIGGCMMFDERYLHENDINEEDLAWNTRADRRLLDDASDLVAFCNYDWDVINYCREHYYKPYPSVNDFIPIKDGDVIDLGGVSLLVTHMPGHTQGSVSFYDGKNHVAYCGDSLSLGDSDLNRVYNILKTCQERWAPDTLICDGHGKMLMRMNKINNSVCCLYEILNGINLENDEETVHKDPGFFKFTKQYAGVSNKPIEGPTVKMTHWYKDERFSYPKKEN